MSVAGAEPGSAAEASLKAKNGMRPGDTIVCISGSYVHNAEELEEVLAWLAGEKMSGRCICTVSLERAVMPTQAHPTPPSPRPLYAGSAGSTGAADGCYAGAAAAGGVDETN